MLINTLINFNKWYLIVKCYQFIIQIDVFGTDDRQRHSHHLISCMKTLLKDTSFYNILKH